jgi:glycosyltransferase involved in cell wall biosynthesis
MADIVTTPNDVPRMLDTITPVLLTFNEAPNIARTLSRLDWAKDIVVVDGGSTDATLHILQSHPRVRVYHHAFESHPAQWRYAMQETGIRTSWVLRLDADYQLTDELVNELASLRPDPSIAAYQVKFDYAIFSRKILSSVYPPKPVLLRQGRYSISDLGHTEGWTVHGPLARLKCRVVHDDWKAMQDWAIAQIRYMRREELKLRTRRTGLRDWLRIHPPLMPVAVFFYCLLVKGLLFSGRAGIMYTLQRVTAETVLAVFILERKFVERELVQRNAEPITETGNTADSLVDGVE